ncbi:hypothetical protein JCM11251_001150 [Rhodosporidiobolus azoricus]
MRKFEDALAKWKKDDHSQTFLLAHLIGHAKVRLTEYKFRLHIRTKKYRPASQIEIDEEEIAIAAGDLRVVFRRIDRLLVLNADLSSMVLQEKKERTEEEDAVRAGQGPGEQETRRKEGP